MIERQVFVGMSAGALSAILALYLSVPHAHPVESVVRSWFASLLATPANQEKTADSVRVSAIASNSGLVRPGLGMLAPATGELRVVVPDGASPRDETELHPEQRVAAIGVIPGVTAEVEEARQEHDLALPLPLERPAPRSDVLDPELYVAALSKQTIIRRAPDPDSPIIGFARTGALLRRAPIPAGHRGCAEGWYRVEPDGYICVGRAASLDPEHPIIRLASLQPDRSLPLPYPYGTSRYPSPPLYTKIPTEAEQKQAEPDLANHVKKGFGQLWAELADTPPPTMLAQGERIPRPYGYSPLEHDFMTGRALADSAFAFIDLFETENRRWGLTADLSILPLDRLEPVRASEFYGVPLSGAAALPIGFMRATGQYIYAGSVSRGVRLVRSIGYREAFHLTGQMIKIGGVLFHETVDGQLIKDHPRFVTVGVRSELPSWAKAERSWIEVSILHQTLVAYRGERPIFATLVSTGRDGLGDPETTHSTPQGTFLIHTKHVTSTMSGTAADDEFDLRDVPYVQFFKDGYAFHAAFWHDVFGQPRSHGCINLSPPDARYLFSITEPAVPLRWHSALSTQGTLVYIHP